MGGRALVITLAGIITLSSTMFVAITSSSSDIMANVDNYYLRQSAQNISQSGINLALRQVANNRAWRAGFPLMDMLDGKVIVRLVDTTLSGRSVIRITSTGIANFSYTKERRETSVAFVPRGFIPATVRAAITTNNPVTTLGSLIVDGRDYDTTGVLIPNQGTLGIWTTRTFAQGGNSTIGGTSAGIDYAPSRPGNPSVIASGQVWPGGYPGSPDSILGGPSNGFPEGTLKSVAQSGIGGSQYVTNPANLTLPLRGVTYVELPSGGIWQSMNITGSGILIVHNNAKNAAMKNLNSGTFKGLMIIDDIVHIHTTIIGAIIGLTPSPSEGNCIGNGNGNVLYSARAIIESTGLFGAGGGGGGSSTNVIAWWE